MDWRRTRRTERRNGRGGRRAPGLGTRGMGTAGGVAAGLAAGLLAVGCSSDPPRVLVIGDSITGLVADDFAARDEHDYRYTLRATNNATSEEMLEEARQLGDIEPRQVIINLGTNDALKDVPLERTQAALRELIGRYDEADCVHLTTLNEQVLSFEDPALPDRMRAINDHLRTIEQRDDRIDLIDWNAVVARYAEEGAPDGPLLTDSVHPTEVGQDILLDHYVAALDGC